MPFWQFFAACILTVFSVFQRSRPPCVLTASFKSTPRWPLGRSKPNHARKRGPRDAGALRVSFSLILGLDVNHLVTLVGQFKELIRERTGQDFPQDPQQQLWGAIGAVFGSWNNDRAIVYRRKYNIPHEWGTAVNVQTMVFGNRGDSSATGVAFTRDPATGEKVFYGEYLINAQGEDVAAGVRTPHPIAMLGSEMSASNKELLKVRDVLERHFHDMQDLEFTIEDNKLYMLQTRSGKRTGLAALRIAVDMVNEGLISKEEAVRRVPADSLAQVLAPVFDKSSLMRVAARRSFRL